MILDNVMSEMYKRILHTLVCRWAIFEHKEIEYFLWKKC